MEYLELYINDNNLTLKTEEVKRKYLCSICDGILVNPKTSSCGCSFCGNCINRCLQNGGVNCPKCQSSIGNMNVYPDVHLANKILELPIECPNTSCSEKVIVKLMENHLKSCSNEGVAYPCKETLNNDSAVRNHMKNVDNHLDLLIKNMNEKNVIIEDLQNYNIENVTKLAEIAVNSEESRRQIDYLNDQIGKHKRELDFLKNNSKSQMDNLNLENNNLKNELSRLSDKMKEFEQENQKLKRYISDMEKRTNSEFIIIRNEIENLLITNKKPEHLEKTKLCNEFCEVRFENLENNWKMANYDSRIVKLNQYSFKIRMRKDIYGYFRFKVVSVRNEDASKLIWPIPFCMKMDLINENNSTIGSTIFHHEKSMNPSDFIVPANEIEIKSSEISEILSSIGSFCRVVIKILKNA